MIPSEIDPNTGLPTGGLTEDADGNLTGEQQRVAEIIKAIAGGPMGQAEVQKRTAECLTVPGEQWIALLMRGETNPDGSPRHSWFVLTRDEIKAKAGGGAEIELPNGDKHDFVRGADAMFRVWNPRARRAKEADSPVRATLDSLREIVRTTKKIKNADKSRLVGGGVWFLPQEMSLPTAQSPVAENQPGMALPVVQGVPAADQLSNLLYNAAQASIEDEDSQAAFIPIMATVPGEHLGKIMKMDLSREVSDVEIKKRNDAIARLAMGLDVSPERLLGVGTNSNHWSAWQIGDEDVQLHVKPVMQLLCQAIYDEVVRPTLLAEGIDANKYVLWFDASQLTADPDLTDEAKDASDRGAITNEALRRYYGLSDDDGYDLTTLEGAQEWARDAIVKDPTLIRELAPLLTDELATIDWPAPPSALPPGQQDGTEEPADESTGQEPDTEGDQPDSSAAAHVATPAELALAERLLVNRALDLAGKRRVNTNALKARLSGIAAHDYHRYLPPVSDADIPRLIKGWDIALEDDVIARMGVDTETLRATVRDQIRRELTRPMVDVVDGQVV